MCWICVTTTLHYTLRRLALQPQQTQKKQTLKKQTLKHQLLVAMMSAVHLISKAVKDEFKAQ
jgi:hypothetical protein